MKVSKETLREIEQALMQYEDRVNGDPDLQAYAKKTYLLHARNFVRWLADDFEPGETLRTGRGTRRPRHV